LERVKQTCPYSSNIGAALLSFFTKNTAPVSRIKINAYAHQTPVLLNIYFPLNMYVFDEEMCHYLPPWKKPHPL
jgi:hypothetical protein